MANKHHHPEGKKIANGFKCFYTEDQYKRDRSEKIATVLAIVLALVPWAVSMPVTYRWSLIGLSLIAVLYLILTIIPLVTALSTVQKISIAIAVLSTALASFWPIIYRQWKSERAAEIEGDITISNGTAKQPVFSLGDSQAILPLSPTLEKTAPNYEALHILYDAGLRLELQDGIVKVSTSVRDRQGRLVASLDKNHWSVTAACLDKNYSSDSLEVLDARGLVVFRMKLLPDRVQLWGEWRDEFGNGARIGGSNVEGGGYIDFWHNADMEQKTMAIIQPMFEYPSVNHWAEMKAKP